MNATEIITLITLPLCGVIVQLQRLIPRLAKQSTDVAETRADVRAIREHLGIPAPSSPATVADVR